MKYTSQKAYFQEYTDGQEGVTYTLSIDNDFDTLVYNSKNQLIIDLSKNPLEVVATRLINGDEISSTAGSFSVTPSNNSWVKGTHYTFADGTLTIKGVPTSFSEVKFTFSWKVSNNEDAAVLNKIFTLKRQNSEVGYKVEFNKSVVNGTQAGKITYKIMKINADGTRTNLGTQLDGQRLYASLGQNIDDTGYDEINKEYFVKYTAGKSSPITVSFKKDDTIIWDTETVEFVLDGAPGPSGNSLMVKYINSATKPTITNNNVTGWSDTIPTVEAGKYIYMTQKMSNATNWSDPVQISAKDGTTPTIQINSNGYWVINGETSTVKAEGDTPVITVGPNGNWFINGVDSGQQAQGETGKDGNCIEYVYYRSKTEQKNLPAPSYTGTTLTTGWTPSPQGITETYKYEYMSVRTKAAGATNWSGFSTPVIWSKWGDKGQDGDGIEYKYCLTNSEEKPVYPAPNGASYVWTDEPSGVSIENKYEYVVSIVVPSVESIAKKINTADRYFSRELWQEYGQKGHEERWTIKEIENPNNYHINLGDYAYIDGFVEEGGTATTPARIYGKVIELYASSTLGGHITMRSTHLIIGDYTVSLWSNYGEPGREEIKRDIYYCITDTNETPSLYEKFNDTRYWQPLSSNVTSSENGLKITIDDAISDTTVFAIKNEQWPESRLVSFEGWITSEGDSDELDVDDFYLNCDLTSRNPDGFEVGFPQFIPRLTKERRRYSYLMELGTEAEDYINSNKDVYLRLFSDISHAGTNDKVPNDIYIENLMIQPVSTNTTWTKNTHAALEKGQYLWSFDIIEYSKEDDFGNKYSVTPIEQRAYLAIDGTSPYLISFDNDSATIGADKNGEVDATTLMNISKVTTKVHFGQTDITSSCAFSWSVGGGVLYTTTGNINYFTNMTSTNASATVTVTYKGAEIGKKTFTISKSFAGQDGTPATTYQLSVTPNEINLTTNPNGVVPSFIVTKYAGSTITNITSGYTISRSDGKTQGAAITSKTIFTLTIDGKTVDTETVEVVNDGKTGKEPLICIRPFTGEYTPGTESASVHSTISTDLNRVPELNERFSTICAGRYYTIFKVTEINGQGATYTAIYKIDLQGSTGGSIMVVHTTYARDQATLESWVGAPNTDGLWAWRQQALVTTLGGDQPLLYDDYKHLKKGDIITFTVKNTTTGEYNFFQARVEGVSETEITAQAISLTGLGGQGPTGNYGTKTESVRVYYRNNTSTPPTKPNTSLGSWTTTEQTLDSNNQYLWSCTGTRTTTYNNATGSGGSTTYNNDWTTPELYKAYTGNANIDPLNYATFLRMSNFKSKQDTFYSSDGKMYINAELLDVNSLVVHNAFSVAINGGRKNLALQDGISIYANPTNRPAEKINAATCSWKLYCPIGAGTGIQFPASFFVDETYYTLKFYVKPIEGELTSIAGHSSCAIDQKFYINGIEQSVAFAYGASVSPALGDELECILVFKCKKGASGSDDNLYIQPNRRNSYATACTCIISNITLYEGKGSYDNIITKINADQAGVSIAGNKINFTTSEFVIQDGTQNTLFAAYGHEVQDQAKRGRVQIAGWEVTKDSITIGTLGTNGFHMYSKNFPSKQAFGSSQKQNWSLGIGSNFGVTSGGSLYCTSGYIGGWVTDTKEFRSKSGTIILDSVNNTIKCSDIDWYDTTTPHRSVIMNEGGLQFGCVHGQDDATTDIDEKLYGTAVANIYMTSAQYDAYGNPILPPTLYIGSRCITLEVLTENTFPGKGLLKGSWYIQKASSGSAYDITSDRNKKHNIAIQNELYSKIFDGLIPTTFKYNDGTSDRVHTGFIAQDVEEAVLSAGLTTKDFAAVCYELDDKGNKNNYGIRYEELISLCVYEIQRLKKQVTLLNSKLDIT